ncbi:hypothetical protein [Kitasatospora griseola]|uniref:hypothetical protein n=1 Tax=Kitasatospora griseola TaxID=2064 RepID=UPI0034210C50
MPVPFADRRRATWLLAAVGGLLVLAVLVSLALLLPGKDDPKPVASGSAGASASASPSATTPTPTPTSGATPSPSASATSGAPVPPGAEGTPDDPDGTTDDGSGGSTGSTGSGGGRRTGGGSGPVRVGGPGTPAPTRTQTQTPPPGGTPSPGPSPSPSGSGSPTPSPSPSPSTSPSPSPSTGPSPSPSPSDGSCPAALEPQVMVTCTLAPGGPTLFRLPVSQARDMVIVQVSSKLYGMVPRLFGPDGKQVACDVSPDTYSYGPARCVTNGAGTYTLRLYDYDTKPLPITLSYLPVFSTDKCVALSAADRSLGRPTMYDGVVPLGKAGDCYAGDFATGDLLRVLHSSLVASVFDATGAEVCSKGDWSVLDCRLAGTAPYRVVVQYGGYPDRTYRLALSRLSGPEGCPVVEPQAYGVAPDLTDVSRCRILRVPADGHYTFRGTGEIGDKSGALYRSDATQLCPDGECDLKAGDYTYTVAPTIYEIPYAMVLRSATDTRGCTVGRDDQMASGAPVEIFDSAGQDRCRTLPTASGDSVFLRNGTAKGETVRYRVLDAAGAVQCQGNTVYDTYDVCRLTGAAPFRLVLTATGAFNYRVMIQRVGETAGCVPWAGSEYGTGSGTRTGLSGTRADGTLETCFTVPADHPAAELLNYRLEGSQFESALHLVDPSGTEFCQIVAGRTDVCRPPAGRPYTALLTYGRALGGYTLVRRDATPSAACDLPASSGKVGGPGVGVAFDTSVDVHCTTFDAATADLLKVGVRTNTDQTSAEVTVVDAEGRTVCRDWSTECRVTGSTRYVALVAARNPGDRTPFPGTLDVWRLATAAGWAPECAAHPVSADGFDQRGGVLTDAAPLYCAVLEMRPGQRVDVAAANDDFLARHGLTVAGRENWADADTAYTCTRDDPNTGISTVCTYNGTTTGHAVLLFTPGRAHLPLAFTLQGARPGTGTERSGVPQWIGPAVATFGGYVEMTVRGTGLSLNSQIDLLPENNRYDNPPVRPLWVSADGTELHVRINLGYAYVGGYDLLVRGTAYKKGVPSPGYLPKAFQVVKG